VSLSAYHLSLFLYFHGLSPPFAATSSTSDTGTPLSSLESPAVFEGDGDSVAVLSRSLSDSESSLVSLNQKDANPYLSQFASIASSERRRTGKCAFFIAKKGYGFIRCDRESELDWIGRDGSSASLDSMLDEFIIEHGAATRAHPPF
jgi:hypothetical protein